MLLVGFGLTFGVSTQASAAGYGSYWFANEDGKWDGTFTVETYGNKVDLWVHESDLGTIPGGHYVKASDMQARLCSASTGRCTGYKRFYYLGEGYFGVNWSDMIWYRAHIGWISLSLIATELVDITL